MIVGLQDSLGRVLRLVTLEQLVLSRNILSISCLKKPAKFSWVARGKYTEKNVIGLTSANTEDLCITK